MGRKGLSLRCPASSTRAATKGRSDVIFNFPFSACSMQEMWWHCLHSSFTVLTHRDRVRALRITLVDKSIVAATLSRVVQMARASFCTLYVGPYIIVLILIEQAVRSWFATRPLRALISILSHITWRTVGSSARRLKRTILHKTRNTLFTVLK